MAVREILVLPDDRLRQISKPVASVTPAVKALVDDMFETMYDAPGIGLAAIQIGVAERVVTMDIAKREGERNRRRASSSIPRSSGRRRTRRLYEEGCLSIPEYYEEVERPSKVQCATWISTASSTRKRPKACSPPASSTRSITSTACCSSIIMSKLKRDRVAKKFAKAAKRARG